MFYQQAPVGNPVCLTESATSKISSKRYFTTHQALFYASGTASLAAAITAALKLKSVERPEVILPAYGCPDLISAALYAGVKPVLIDLERDRPWLCLEKLAKGLNERTVAVVSVDLFGLPDRFDALRELTHAVDALLIEDSAQWFPGKEESESWQGDLVVISFGRGKPVSLLGGGAVLYKDDYLGELLPRPEHRSSSGWAEQISYRIKAHLYNHMISPRLYWLPQALPLLHLGETRYHPLNELCNMDEERLALLHTNIAAYREQQRNMHQQYSKLLVSFANEEKIVDLPMITGTPVSRSLLRYPLLVDHKVRSSLFHALRRAGMGPSLMYPEILPEITGLEGLFEDKNGYPQARSFAKRILTLPTHNRVRERDLMTMRGIIASVCNG